MWGTKKHENNVLAFVVDVWWLSMHVMYDCLTDNHIRTPVDLDGHIGVGKLSTFSNKLNKNK